MKDAQSMDVVPTKQVRPCRRDNATNISQGSAVGIARGALPTRDRHLRPRIGRPEAASLNVLCPDKGLAAAGSHR